MKESEKIVLGSGTCYCAEYADEIPDDAVIEQANNLLGLIQGGATLEYKPEFYSAADDLGLVSKTILTKEVVTFKTGVMTWNGKTLAKLCSTARVTEDAETLTRVVKIGGVKNQSGKKYVIHFVHEDAVDGDIRVTIVGENQSGFSLAFTKDKETVVDAEFIAAPNDSEGTLVIYKEDIPALSVSIDDLDALAIESSVPASNATGVALDAQVKLLFTEKIATATVTVMTAAGAVAPIDASTLSGAQVTISFTEALAATTEYYVVVSKVKDVYGRLLTAEIIKFTTAGA